MLDDAFSVSALAVSTATALAAEPGHDPLSRAAAWDISGFRL
jgi:hypothetical protein